MVEIIAQSKFKNAVIAQYKSDVDQFVQPVVDGVKHRPIYAKAGIPQKFRGRGKYDVKDHVLTFTELGSSPRGIRPSPWALWCKSQKVSNVKPAN